MEYRHLGNSGLEVSLVGLGGNTFGGRCDAQATTTIVNTALDLGVNLIDTADIYGPGLSEEYIGQAVRGRRREAVIATKFALKMNGGHYRADGSRRYIMEAVESSLRRLGTDYIDLYQIHMPDPKTPIEETLRALDDLVRRGVVRYVGCVNYKAWQLADAAWTARTEHLTPFISAENRYNIMDRGIESELLPACERFGAGVLPFLPLGGGFLTGKYRAGEQPPEDARLATGGMSSRMLNEGNFAILGRLEAVAGERGHTLLDLAMGWLSAQPRVSSIIAGATRPEQVEQNVRAGEWKMTAEDLAAVDAALAA